MVLLGAFLAEGYSFSQPRKGDFGIDVCLTTAPHRDEILVELRKLGVKFGFHDHGDKLRIYSKQLCRYFSRFGRAPHKFIPPEVFNYSRRDLETLFRWLIWGDGHRHRSGRAVNYSTTSRQLADDVQRLCLHVGKAANVVQLHGGGPAIVNHQLCNTHPAYSVRIINTKLTPTANHSHVHKQHAQHEHIVENYAGPVFGITVPNPALYVRRNGKPVWSGSSSP